MIDLDEAPYRDYVELLHELRTNPGSRELVEFAETVSDERGTHDGNEQERARIAFVMHVDPADDLDLVRFMLDQEILARRADSFQGAGDVLMMLSLRLLELGGTDDIWRFWSAKCANFDTIAGGYDIEFVFAFGADAALRVLADRGEPKDRAFLEKYDVDAIVARLPEWREKLTRRYPRDVATFDHGEAAHWADVFGDLEAYEHHRLQLVETSQDRAYLCREMERFEQAVEHWRAAADEAATDWDRASMLQRAMTDAAHASLPMLDDVAALDALRAQIPQWNEVGLGRMATQACYELAAAVRTDAGRELFRTAERWRHDLASFTLVGLRAAVAAAKVWGDAEEIRALEDAAQAEDARIKQMLAD